MAFLLARPSFVDQDQVGHNHIADVNAAAGKVKAAVGNGKQAVGNVMRGSVEQGVEVCRAEAKGKGVEADTLTGAQGGGYDVVEGGAGVKLLPLHGHAALGYTVDVAGDVGNVPLARTQVERVGGSTEAYIRLLPPIARVMARAEAWTGEVAYLVMLVARGGKAVNEFVVHGEAKLVVNLAYTTFLEHGVKGRTLLVHKAVCRDMLHAEADGTGDVVAPFGDCFAWEAEHQVNAYVGYARPAEVVHRHGYVCRAVPAAQEAQTGVGEGLHTHADTVDGSAGDGMGEVWRNVVGIALDGNLCLPVDVKHIIYI